MSTFAVVRATFLTFAFPPIIDYGRKWYASSSQARSKTGRPLGPSRGASYTSTYASYTNGNGTGRSNGQQQHADDDAHSIASNSSSGSSASSSSSEADSAHGGFSKDSEHHAKFDLDFLRWSCVLDGVLTGVLTWSGRGWQMYIGGHQSPASYPFEYHHQEE